MTKIIVSVRNAHRPGPSSPPKSKMVLNPSPAVEPSPDAANGASPPDDTNTSLMTPDNSCARAIDHAAGVATSITPTIANVDAKRRGEPSERERITSTTETNRVNTKSTAIVCKARRKFLSSTSEVISLRRTSATTIVAIGMTTPSNSRAADNVVRRNNDGAPGTKSAPITDPEGPLLPDSSSLGVVVDESMSANRFNAL